MHPPRALARLCSAGCALAAVMPPSMWCVGAQRCAWPQLIIDSNPILEAVGNAKTVLLAGLAGWRRCGLQPVATPPHLRRLSFVTPAAPATAAAPFAAAPSAAAPSAPSAATPFAEIRWVHRVRLSEVEVEVEVEDSAAAASSKERQEAEVMSRGGAEEADVLQLIHEGSPGSSGSPQSPKSPKTPHTAPRWSPDAIEHDNPAAVAEPPRPGVCQSLTRITSFA